MKRLSISLLLSLMLLGGVPVKGMLPESTSGRVALAAVAGLGLYGAYAFWYRVPAKSLVEAAEDGDLDAVRQHIRAGTDVNRADYNGRTALIEAAGEGHGEVVGTLLAVDGIEVNHANYDGRTALSRAAYRGRGEMVRTLLAVDGIEVDRVDDKGKTALAWAARAGHGEVVHMLAGAGAAVNSLDFFGKTPLMRAVGDTSVRVNLPVVRALLDARADVNHVNPSGRTALTFAVYRGDGESMQMLLDAGADVNLANCDGWTPLMWAASYHRHEVVRILLAHRAEDQSGQIVRVNREACNHNGLTALHLAITSFANDKKRAECVAALLCPGIPYWETFVGAENCRVYAVALGIEEEFDREAPTEDERRALIAHGIIDGVDPNARVRERI